MYEYGNVELEIYENVFHAWQLLIGFAPEANEAVRKIIAFIDKHLALKQEPQKDT